jgi:hypothetical protein
VYAGLASFFTVRATLSGPELPGLPYPPPGLGPDSAVRELPLAIQDRAFDIFNQLYYPKQTTATLPTTDALPNGPVPPTWVPGKGWGKNIWHRPYCHNTLLCVGRPGALNCKVMLVLGRILHLASCNSYRQVAPTQHCGRFLLCSHARNYTVVMP